MALKRKPLIAGNWKMNGLKKDARVLSAGLAGKFSKLKKPSFEMLICPPFPLLSVAIENVRDSGIKIGAQDCHPSVAGAHTGDVSALLLKNLGCSYVILGHSERRNNYGETDRQVRAKA